MKRFKKWIKWANLTQTEAAKLLGTQQSRVGLLAKGATTPGVKLALSIQQATKKWPEGPITIDEWVK